MKIRNNLMLSVFCSLFLVIQVQAQRQEQADTLRQSPFAFEASYLGDAAQNFTGGIKKGSTYLGMANIMLGFNTEKAGLWKGGEAYLNAANTHGGQPSASLIGDFQVASNIEAGDLTYLHELWFKQNIGKAAIVIGLQDLCVEFLSSENAGLFLNSSCGVHSTIASNLSAPIFPLTALGAQFHYKFFEKFTFKISAFDGVPDDMTDNKHNINWKLSKDEGFLSFSEISFVNTPQSGSYKLGAYYQNKHKVTTEVKDSIPIIESFPENYGLYLVVDRSIHKFTSGQELSFFILSSLSPKSINENWYHLGGGLNLKGLFNSRCNDVLGLALSHTGINKTLEGETTLELTYKANLGENFFFQPDIQYIMNPSGTDKVLRNALVGFLRFGISF